MHDELKNNIGIARQRVVMLLLTIYEGYAQLCIQEIHMRLFICPIVIRRYGQTYQPC